MTTRDNGKEMLSSLTNEIIPFIQEKYHAGNNRILVGHSLGGTFVTYAMMEHPDLFPYIIAISPNYKYSENMMIDRLRVFTETYQGEKKIIYLPSQRRQR